MVRHFTVTAHVIHEGRALLIFHHKFQKWLPPGGHLEPNELPHAGAAREVLEETGYQIEFISQENIEFKRWNAWTIPRPYIMLVGDIPARGSEPHHEHIDLLYLARPIGEPVEPKDRHPMRWWSLDEIEALESDQEIFEDTKHILRHLLAPVAVG